MTETFPPLSDDVLTLVLSFVVDEYGLVCHLINKRFRSIMKGEALKKRKREEDGSTLEILSCRRPYCERVPLLDWAISFGMPRGVVKTGDRHGDIEDLSDLACRNKSQDFAVLEHLFATCPPLDVEGDPGLDGDGRHNYVKICHAAALGRVDLLKNLKRLIESIWGGAESSWYAWDECMRSECGRDACIQAALGGHLITLKWLKAHGCDWGPSTCTAATLGGSEELQRWVRTQQEYPKCCDCTSLEDHHVRCTQRSNLKECQRVHTRGWPVYGCKPKVVFDHRNLLDLDHTTFGCPHFPLSIPPLLPRQGSKLLRAHMVFPNTWGNFTTHPVWASFNHHSGEELYTPRRRILQ